MSPFCFPYTISETWNSWKMCWYPSGRDEGLENRLFLLFFCFVKEIMWLWGSESISKQQIGKKTYAKLFLIHSFEVAIVAGMGYTLRNKISFFSRSHSLWDFSTSQKVLPSTGLDRDAILNYLADSHPPPKSNPSINLANGKCRNYCNVITDPGPSWTWVCRRGCV